MKALVNLDADLTMFILISPPPVLKVCVMVWYCGTEGTLAETEQIQEIMVHLVSESVLEIKKAGALFLIKKDIFFLI